MTATDAPLFSVVLITYVFAITFVFVIELSPENRAGFPRWVKLGGITELKKRSSKLLSSFLS